MYVLGLLGLGTVNFEEVLCRYIYVLEQKNMRGTWIILKITGPGRT